MRAYTSTGLLTTATGRFQGLCATVLKKVCRQLGVFKWPYKETKLIARRQGRIIAASAPIPEDLLDINEKVAEKSSAPRVRVSEAAAVGSKRKSNDRSAALGVTGRDGLGAVAGGVAGRRGGGTVGKKQRRASVSGHGGRAPQAVDGDEVVMVQEGEMDADARDNMSVETLWRHEMHGDMSASSLPDLLDGTGSDRGYGAVSPADHEHKMQGQDSAAALKYDLGAGVVTHGMLGTMAPEMVDARYYHDGGVHWGMGMNGLPVRMVSGPHLLNRAMPAGMDGSVGGQAPLRYAGGGVTSRQHASMLRMHMGGGMGGSLGAGMGMSASGLVARAPLHAPSQFPHFSKSPVAHAGPGGGMFGRSASEVLDDMLDAHNSAMDVAGVEYPSHHPISSTAMSTAMMELNEFVHQH